MLLFESWTKMTKIFKKRYFWVKMVFLEQIHYFFSNCIASKNWFKNVNFFNIFIKLCLYSNFYEAKYFFNPLVTSRLYIPEIFKYKFSAKNIRWELSALHVVFIYQPKKHLSKDLAPQHIRIWRKLKSKLKKWKKSSHFQKGVANFLFMTN